MSRLVRQLCSNERQQVKTAKRVRLSCLQGVIVGDRGGKEFARPVKSYRGKGNGTARRLSS